MEDIVRQLSQDNVWNMWVAANSFEENGCISAGKDGCISVVKDGCISVVKEGCISSPSFI